MRVLLVGFILASAACSVANGSDVASSRAPTGAPTSVSTIPEKPATTLTTIAAVELGAVGCNPPSGVMPWKEGLLVEARATSPDDVFALLWESPPWVVGHEVKVVVRIPSHGSSFEVTAVGPGGDADGVTWGPYAHGAESNFDRPGKEWGFAVTPMQAGCWHIHMRTEISSGDLWIHVVET